MDARVVMIPGIDVKRAKFVPTARQREVVSMLAANMVPRKIIAMALDIGERTLDKHFVKEIQHGRDQMVARVGVAVLRKALKGNMNAARFWLMTHGGPEWRLGNKDAAAEAVAFAAASANADRDGRKVMFYLPENGRDRPDTSGAIDVMEDDLPEADVA